jgi:hypothetical protein
VGPAAFALAGVATAGLPAGDDRRRHHVSGLAAHDAVGPP